MMELKINGEPVGVLSVEEVRIIASALDDYVDGPQDVLWIDDLREQWEKIAQLEEEHEAAFKKRCEDADRPAA